MRNKDKNGIVKTIKQASVLSFTGQQKMTVVICGFTKLMIKKQ